MADKKAFHPDGKRFVRFQEQFHTYTDNVGKRYVSGTSFLKKFSHKFDAVAVSIKCAAGDNPKYTGRSPKDIRQEWSAEGKRGSDEGNNIHEYAEFCDPLSSKEIKPISERCEKIFKQVDYAYEQMRQKSFIILDLEMIIFSPELGIAGMIDILIYDPHTCEIIFGDWKNNKNPLTTQNFFQSYKKPIDHLQDTDINKFSLQLSLYQYIFKNENYYPDMKIDGFRRAVIHVNETFAKPIQLEYMDYEIREMLKHDKRI